MSLPIFGAGNKKNSGQRILGGSSMPKEKRMDDIKLSSRKAKSNMESLTTRDDAGKKIAGRTTP